MAGFDRPRRGGRRGGRSPALAEGSGSRTLRSDLNAVRARFRPRPRPTPISNPPVEVVHGAGGSTETPSSAIHFDIHVPRAASTFAPARASTLAMVVSFGRGVPLAGRSIITSARSWTCRTRRYRQSCPSTSSTAVARAPGQVLKSSAIGPFLRHAALAVLFCPLLAQPRSADRVRKCLMLGGRPDVMV